MATLAAQFVVTPESDTLEHLPVVENVVYGGKFTPDGSTRGETDNQHAEISFPWNMCIRTHAAAGTQTGGWWPQPTSSSNEMQGAAHQSAFTRDRFPSLLQFPSHPSKSTTTKFPYRSSLPKANPKQLFKLPFPNTPTPFRRSHPSLLRRTHRQTESGNNKPRDQLAPSVEKYRCPWSATYAAQLSILVGKPKNLSPTAAVYDKACGW